MISSRRCLVLLLICLFLSFNFAARHPVILVPGDGGSQLEAKLAKPEVVHYLCQKTSSDYFSLWLNLELLVPLVIDCFVDNSRLVYDNVTRLTSNAPGVDIRVPGFGNTSTVEWLDPSESIPGAYFHNIAYMMVTRLNYTSGIDLHGAPYDFRKAPNEQQEYFTSLRKLVEDTVLENGERAVLVSHSMGGLMCLTFLQQQTQQWKDKHLRAFVPLAAPWGGTVKSLKVFAVGDNLGVFALSEGTLRDEQRTSPSLAWLLPSTLFWKPGEVLVSTPDKNYTILDLKQYFEDLSWPVGWEMRVDTEKYLLDLRAPGVEVHCAHGSGVPTVATLKYDQAKFPDQDPQLVTGDGDGTVNLRSLHGCSHWTSAMNAGYPVSHQEFQGLDHMQCLRHASVVQYLHDLLAFKINK